MGKHLTREQKETVVTDFTINLIPMIDLAERYHVTRQCIWKVIKQAGVDIASCARITVSCSACGKEIIKHRERIRNRKHNFCSKACYTAFLDAGNGHQYNPSRAGQRFGRAVVSKYHKLLKGQVVHHEDRNCLNNDVENLKVFANQGDHIRYHRLGAGYAIPVWEGCND